MKRLAAQKKQSKTIIELDHFALLSLADYS
jgi:hypothetical protein